jgi:Xaa-Pro aminopeptidase
MGATSFADVQSFMRQQRIDGWLIYDFRGSNSVLAQLLPGKRFLTRRVLLYLPSEGQPELLVHSIDASQFADAPVHSHLYLSWQELHGWIQKRMAGGARVAMEYSPKCALPVVSIADAGTVELVRAFGGEVISSADLIQVCVARWDADAQRNHAKASAEVARIKDGAFASIGQALSRGEKITEHDVQQKILRDFADAGLETPDPPIVAANAHSGDPHFEVSETSPATIARGDWILIDLWARVPGDQNIYSDITWVGCAGEPTARQREVFNVVKSARDRCVDRAVQAWRAGEDICGWQLDDAARGVIIDAGFEKYIRHRTGHSLSRGAKVHGMGVNIDNLETHDTRRVLPGIGYTVEPGVYLPEFGVRLEINVLVDPDWGPTITSCVQEDVVHI